MGPPLDAIVSVYEHEVPSFDLDLSQFKGDSVLAKNVYEAVRTDELPISRQYFNKQFSKYIHRGPRFHLYIKKKNINMIACGMAELKFRATHWPSPEDYANETGRHIKTIKGHIEKGYIEAHNVIARVNGIIRTVSRMEPNYYSKKVEEHKELQNYLEKTIGFDTFVEQTGIEINLLKLRIADGSIETERKAKSEGNYDEHTGVHVRYTPEEVDRVRRIIRGVDNKGMIDFLRKNEISLSLNELIERADEFKPNQILPLNKFKNEYKFSHELTQEILTHYRRLDNKKLFDELSPKGWHVGNVAISGNLEGIIEEEHSNDDQNVPKRKRRESRRRRRRGNHGFSSEERDLIMEEILSTPLLKREEEMELGQKIAVLEKRIISYLYSSHRTIINEFYDELENYTGSGQKEKNHAGREYREIVRETHEVLVSEVGEKSVIDLLWNLYSQKRDASYLKSMLKLVCEYDDIKSDVTKWKKCLEKLIMGNSSTSFQVAKKYSDVNKFNKWDDHFQVSFLGQIRASEIWDYTTGNRFNTIGSYWTKAKTTRNINNTGYTVRIPVHLREKLYVVNRGLGEGLSFEEIVSKMGLTKDEIKNLLIAKKIEQDGGSLNKKVGENGDSELIDFVKDENRPNPEEETVEIHKKRAINHAFSTLLTERQAEVMKLRFGIGCEKNHTLEEIGDIFGVTREAVRQAEVRSLKKIRKNIKISSILKEFWQ